MITAHEANPQRLVDAAKEELKNVAAVKPPAWSAYVKTGVSRERPPQQIDWWYSRAASVLRKIYIEGPVGTQRLRNVYGGRKNRGARPEHFYKGSGSSVRKILQQLETAGLVKKEGTKGRVVTPQGKKMLDMLAKKLVG
ncbi:MAG: 30S ribosomal protein S19e [Candidatus Aenigmatarchaeota archaeon]|nr:MAG: 30S ribosomal protein S19e [Candidatus Aenigmarchaeota archaeon]